MDIKWYYGSLMLRPEMVVKITIPELTHWDKIKIAAAAFSHVLIMVCGIVFLIATGPQAIGAAAFGFIMVLALGARK